MKVPLHTVVLQWNLSKPNTITVDVDTVDDQLYQKNVHRRMLSKACQIILTRRLGYKVAFYKPHKTLNPCGAYILVYDLACEGIYIQRFFYQDSSAKFRAWC